MTLVPTKDPLTGEIVWMSKGELRARRRSAASAPSRAARPRLPHKSLWPMFRLHRKPDYPWLCWEVDAPRLRYVLPMMVWVYHATDGEPLGRGESVVQLCRNERCGNPYHMIHARSSAAKRSGKVIWPVRQVDITEPPCDVTELMRLRHEEKMEAEEIQEALRTPLSVVYYFLRPDLEAIRDARL